MNEDIYREWRDTGIPCGVITCEWYDGYEIECQFCCAEDSVGDPMVANCKKYVPDPRFIVDKNNKRKA